MVCTQSGIAALIRNLSGPTPFARMLAPEPDAMLRITDKTGLTGFYDFTLDIPPANGLDPDIPALIERQLGLKLEPRKITLDVLIVDSASKSPTEN